MLSQRSCWVPQWLLNSLQLLNLVGVSHCSQTFQLSNLALLYGLLAVKYVLLDDFQVF